MWYVYNTFACSVIMKNKIVDVDGLENWQCFDRRRNDKTQMCHLG